ncbi:hypothetical protein [Nocardia sp. NBC_00416]|uniref:hypothetical protein n=1 Tax=Nocardia sp. NBC_00416 TaxID=2975991 RepID=UPI002E2148DD
MHRFSGEGTCSTPQDLAYRVEHLLDEQARVTDELISAEDAYIEAIAAGRAAGVLHRPDLVEAYTRLRSWGISNFANRWTRLVGVGIDELAATTTAPAPPRGRADPT